jgi:hypothetical protein
VTPAAQHLYIAAALAVVLWICWQALERDLRCGYCGGFTHKQDCPFDYMNREER